jgi:sugar phosphate isomerase/epimerase
VADAHDQKTTHSYVVHYPPHPPRRGDPHYRDFMEYRRRTRATAQCAFAVRINDPTECAGGLELHHDHIEFAQQNGVDFARLEHMYPGVSDPESVGAWIESAENLVWYCEKHHRGHGGVHVASASDFEASHFVKGMIE